MYVIMLCVVIGIAAGWLTGRKLRGNQYGLAMDVAMGVVGAVGSGLLFMKFATHFQVAYAVVGAVSGAILMTILGAYINGRKRYA
jgi:uncharacterized membrane protein YeaQ/YmgE (transglycosylase-associated protein family)